MQINLYCFPHAGGNAINFLKWHHYLPDSISVVPIEYPGHLNNLSQPLITDMTTLINYLMSILQDRLETPYCFYGHSLGALVSFELVRCLRRYNLPLPIHLFLSGHNAPQFFSRRKFISHLPDQGFLAVLKELYGGISEQFINSKELQNIFLPILRADFNVLESYRYYQEAPLACAITAIAGNTDPVINKEGLLGWQEHTANIFNAKFLLGDHFSLLNNPADLMQIVRTSLALD